jgi:hypothetical protein
MGAQEISQPQTLPRHFGGGMSATKNFVAMADS